MSGFSPEVIEHGVDQPLVGDGEQVGVEVGAQVSLALPAAQQVGLPLQERLGVAVAQQGPAIGPAEVVDQLPSAMTTIAACSSCSRRVSALRRCRLTSLDPFSDHEPEHHGHQPGDPDHLDPHPHRHELREAASTTLTRNSADEISPTARSAATLPPCEARSRIGGSTADTATMISRIHASRGACRGTCC